MVSGAVHGAPTSSTIGTRCGGFTGCATRQRARPARFSVNRLGDDRRDGRGEDRVGRGQRIELGEDRALGLDGLRHVLLHEARAVERIGDAFRRAHARRRPFRIVHEAVLRQFVQPFGNEAERLVGDALDRVVHRGVPAGAREHHGPGAADQARSDDGDAGHGLSFTSTISAVAARDRRAAASRRRSRSPTRAPGSRCGRRARARDRGDDRRSPSRSRSAAG